MLTFENEPDTVLFGISNAGIRYAVVTYGTNELPTGQWQASQQRIPCPTVYALDNPDSGAMPVTSFSDDLLLKSTNDELDDVAKAFRLFDCVGWWRDLRLAQIRAYDNSTEVNCFQVGDTPMWLDKATRVGLVNSITIEKAAGIEVTTLWYDNQSFTAPVDDVLAMLYRLELYAKECFNVTASHLSLVQSMTSLSDIKGFDFKSGYPPILHFNL